MKTKRLGSRGPEISVVGYGAWEAGGTSWGDGVPDEQTIEAIRKGVEAGITWVDTAEVYGHGRSEELVAQALRGFDHVMVFTKVAPRDAGSGFDAASVRRAAEGSLRRLGRDVIDLYQLHWPDDSIPVEETWGALAALADEGLVRWIGVSNFDRGLIERCLAIRHVDSLQQQFSMLHREDEHDLFPWCASRGIGVLAFGPLAYGLLTGAITRETVFDDDDWRSGKRESSSFYDELFAPGKIEPNLATVERLRVVAGRVGSSTAQLALAWILSHDSVTAAIAGSRSAKHTVENAGAAALTLDAATLEEIEAILADR
ncbi:MAG TPA: aldo/keto reductase [Actinomycetota bacterium]|nr:aldo/keto reductase [Actinomycetota bacterium]